MRFRKAFTLTEISIVVVIIGLLLAIAVPSFLKAREVSRAKDCKRSLRNIEGAKQQWAREKHKSENATPTWNDLVGAGSGLLTKPFCLEGGVYTIGSLGEDPTCSIKGHQL